MKSNKIVPMCGFEVLKLLNSGAPALDASLEKWIRTARIIREMKEPSRLEGFSQDECALCVNCDGTCIFCPLYAIDACCTDDDSPYQAFQNTRNDDENYEEAYANASLVIYNLMMLRMYGMVGLDWNPMNPTECDE